MKRPKNDTCCSSDEFISPGKGLKGARPPGRARQLVLCASALAVVCGYGGAAQAAPKLKVLFSFVNLKGSNPHASLIKDGAGDLYGATAGGGENSDGVVFELTPPAAGKKHWTETVLKAFNGADGNSSLGSLVADAAGNLYGTTDYGGASNEGVVFQLSPPKGGKKAWAEKVLQSFDGTNGGYPEVGLIADGAGNLYGTTIFGGANGDGVVFELSPPKEGKKAWTETVLQTFDGANGQAPTGNLTADGAGDLYGATEAGGPNGNGVVYELSPPAEGQTDWTETVLQSFESYAPNGSLIVDGAGNLYGTTALGGTNGDGSVFELSPPTGGKTTWTQTVLYSFDGADGNAPFGGLIKDTAGNFYGTTVGGGANSWGVAFELSPPKQGKKAWTEKVLQSFDGTNGKYPEAGLIVDSEGNLYGTTYEGGANDDGVVFKVTP